MRNSLRAKGGFSLIEVMLALAIIGVGAMAAAWTFPSLSMARLRADADREAIAWHHQYCNGLQVGDFDRAATTSSSAVQSTFTLPSGLVISVTDTFSAPVASMSSALFIRSTATWPVSNGSGTGSSVITVARGTPPTTL